MWRIYFNLDEQPLRLGVRVNSRNWDYGLGTPSLYYTIRGGALPRDPLTAYRRTASRFYAYFSLGQPTSLEMELKEPCRPIIHYLIYSFALTGNLNYEV